MQVRIEFRLFFTPSVKSCSYTTQPLSMRSFYLSEESDRVAVEPWPGQATHCPGAAEEWTVASIADGGVRASWGAAAHHGQYQRQGLPHHGGPAVCPEHLSSHGLHLWHRPAQGTADIFYTTWERRSCVWNLKMKGIHFVLGRPRRQGWGPLVISSDVKRLCWKCGECECKAMVRSCSSLYLKMSLQTHGGTSPSLPLHSSGLHNQLAEGLLALNRCLLIPNRGHLFGLPPGQLQLQQCKIAAACAWNNHQDLQEARWVHSAWLVCEYACEC